jgi:GT2 family glycosyltransferase
MPQNQTNQRVQRGLSIVIPSWNGLGLLEKFLPTVTGSAAAFQARCQQPAEILVADDGRDGATSAWLGAKYPSVRYEPSDRRAGFAPTVNRGVRAARYSLVYVLNNDVALEPGTLPPLARHFAAPEAFAVASQVYDYASGALRGAGQLGEFRRGFLGIHRRYFATLSDVDQPWLTLFATGGSSMFDREKFLALGGFEELFAPYGWEDVELALRAWKQGFEVRYEPESRVWHQFSSTITPSFPRREVRAVYERNRLLAHWLHLDTPLQFTAHTSFLLAKLLGAGFAGRWESWSAALQALAMWQQIRARRQGLRAGQQRKLMDILLQISRQLDRPGVQLLNERTAPTQAYLPRT